MSDLIRRDDVYIVLKKVSIREMPIYVFDKLWNGIRDLPSAEPEPKKGKWIYDTERVAGDGWTYSQYHCSECGFQELGGLANFCPNCGAEMTRGE